MNNESPHTAADFRRWSLCVVAVLAFFVTGNFVLWITTTSRLFFPAPNHGDLARVGYLPTLATPRHERCTLPRRQITFDEARPGAIDVVTVGDSISRGRGGGDNNFYQDHIATAYGLTTLHLVENAKADFLEAMIIYHNSGFFRELGAKHVILQSAERHAVDRYGRDVNWSSTQSTKELWDYFRTNQTHKSIAEVNRVGRERERILHESGALAQLAAYAKLFCFMHIDDAEFGKFQKWVNRRYEIVPFEGDAIASDGLITNMPRALNVNMKYLTFKLFYLFDMKDRQPVTTLYKVNSPLFAEADGRQFLAHIGDLRNQVLAERPGWMEKMHDNFNRLAGLLREDGITLHVMISPNKLTVYQPYLTDKSVPRSIFFERMRSFTDREYEFVDTEKVISDLIARGEKDVYFAGDSHWSDKPLDGIVRSMRLGDPAVAEGPRSSVNR